MGPTREDKEVEPDQVVEGACSFPVRAHFSGKVTFLTWTDASGAETLRQIQIWPGYKVTYTNLDTGKAKTYSDSGPGFFEKNPDGSETFVGTGNWTWPKDPVGTKRGIFMSRGRWVAAPDGSVLSLHGTTKDVCADLAG